MATKKTTKITERAVIIGHGHNGYGLCFGYTTETNEAILARGNVTLDRARNIVRYESGKGGLTTLAVEGPHGDSRFGKPTRAGIAEVLTILDVSDVARNKFENFA
jgi:hypothetical protein